MQNVLRGIAEWTLRSKRYTPPASCRVRVTSDREAPRSSGLSTSLLVSAGEGEALIEFLHGFGVIRDSIHDDLEGFVDRPQLDYILKMLDYTCLEGKLLRGMLVVEATDLLYEGSPEHREFTVSRAHVLGWCTELLQAYLLIIDDILDRSEDRRGKPCWYRVDGVGPLNAICDGVLVKSLVFRVLERWFGGTPECATFIRLFNLAAYATELGQAADTDGERTRDITRFDMAFFQRIARNKTSYYTYILPLELALHLTGQMRAPAFDVATFRRLCEVMGEYYQAQNDMLDLYGDKSVTGKLGTDIAERKCTWPLVIALERATPAQARILQHGHDEISAASMAAVRAVYEELSVDRAFFQYADEVEAWVRATIDTLAQQSLTLARVCELAWGKTKKAGSTLRRGRP